MEFLYVDNEPTAPVDAVRVNWYYRPKDIQRRVQDTRVVFASMHSDTCPLTSLRGRCNIQHLSSIGNLDDYRVQKDCFWFDKLYDRYMQRYYEVIPTSKVVNVPEHVKKVLDERWKYVLVEVGRARELTSESKRCRRCEKFAANNDSVDCAVCKNTYHMLCVRPPLLKKPARGFAWACAACSRAQELRLEARHTPTMTDSSQAPEEETLEEEEEDLAARERMSRESSMAQEAHPEPTAAQVAQANLWPYRYLGVHSRAEDALDYDDRIYPRASSRLGPRHQANVNVWHGRPVEFVKAADIKRKYVKTASKKDTKLSKETVAALEAEKDQRSKRPKWVLDEPSGYISRGGDEPIEVKGKKEYTAQLTFKMPPPSMFTERGGDEPDTVTRSEKLVDDYMEKVKAIAPQYNVNKCSTDFLTKAVERLQENSYDVEKALEAMKRLHIRHDLKQPDLNREEVKRFEEGVAKYGSELYLVSRHANIKHFRVVRFYYMWKKTERGKQIWGGFEGRRSKKESKRLDKDGATRVLDEVANDQDDSAFDNEKAAQKKRGFECKFCASHSSRQWRRAPGTPPGTLVPRDASSKGSKDKSTWLTLALCGRCAYLWRRYAIQYESIEEVSKKIAAAGGRASKRKIDEELMKTLLEAQYESGDLISKQTANEAIKAGMEVLPNIVQSEEPSKKKTKLDKELPTTTSTATPEVIPEKRKVVVEKPPEPELLPEPPRVKIHPCAVCRVIEHAGDELFKCRDCRLHVHRTCYGITGEPNPKAWFCDMCRNDHNMQVSTTYECVLCPVKHTAQELMEAPKVSHKKKTDREREKERVEREMLQAAGKMWRDQQEAAGRPVNPREALKRTAWNNWIHITCALWTKEIKFGNADVFDDAEGVGYILPEQFKSTCKVCKQPGLPTVKCYSSTCSNHTHVGCAHQAGYIFGFDVTPVKGSRRDAVNIMKLDQESGVVNAAIWCPSHGPPPTTIVHNMLESTESGLTAMQLFARTYKQVDKSMTGTVRRAAQFTFNPCQPAPVAQSNHRRTSTLNTNQIASHQQLDRVAAHSLRNSPEAASPRSVGDSQNDITMTDAVTNGVEKRPDPGTERKCCTCCVEVSPKWWTVQPSARKSKTPPVINGDSPHMSNAQPLADAPTNGTTLASTSPVVQQSQATTSARRQVSPMVNGTVKTEPADSTMANLGPQFVPETMYQCHKCHINKKTPPSSPSQVRPRQRSRQEPPPEPLYYQAPFVPPPSVYPVPRPSMDGLPPPQPLGAPVVTHHSPWPGGAAHWSAPVMRNGSQSAHSPGGVYGGPPTYRPEYGSPYAARPSHLPQYAGIPPPAVGGQPLQNGVPQQPSPTPYPPLPSHQHPALPHSQPSRPQSPPRFGIDRPAIPSPNLGVNGSSVLSRHFAPDTASGSTSNYSGPPRLGLYAQPAPPQRTVSQVQSVAQQSLAQMAQAAGEQATATTEQIRPSSVDRAGIPPSPSMANRHATPSDGGQEQRGVPGASASPSLRNLLS